MRNEREMFDLILHVAKGNERVRGAWLNGSRANPNVPKDRWQDYDIVYLVKAMDSFLADHSWIDVFGERLMLQMPETMRDPLGDGRFTYLILLADGNRIDLTLVPAEKPGLLGEDSLTVPLLDKDGILRHHLLRYTTPDGREMPSMALALAQMYHDYWDLGPVTLPPVDGRNFWYMPFCGMPGDFDESISIYHREGYIKRSSFFRSITPSW